MYDPQFDAFFNLRSQEKLNHRWWGGQPVSTVSKQQRYFFWSQRSENVSVSNGTSLFSAAMIKGLALIEHIQ